MQKEHPSHSRNTWTENRMWSEKKHPKHRNHIRSTTKPMIWPRRNNFYADKRVYKRCWANERKKSTTTKHSPITDADNSDKTKWRNNINYLGWVQTFSHPYTKHIKHPRNNTTKQNNRTTDLKEQKQSEERKKIRKSGIHTTQYT